VVGWCVYFVWEWVDCDCEVDGDIVGVFGLVAVECVL